MCRDRQHSGRRCPHDTSAARQTRRVAARERKYELTRPLTNESRYVRDDGLPAYTDLAGIRAHAADLRKRMYATADITDATLRDQADQRLEEELTRFGRVLGARADTHARHHPDEMARLERAMETEIYGDIASRSDAVHEARYDILDELRAVVEAAYESGLLDEDGPRWIYQDATPDDYRKLLGATATADQLALFERFEQNSKLRDALDAGYAAKEETYKARRAALYADMRQRLGGAYRRVIRELREVGGAVVIDEIDSDWNAAVLLRKTVGQDYPSEWLTASANFDGPAFRVVSTSERASYTEEITDPNGALLTMLLSDENYERLHEIVTIPKDDAMRHGTFNNFMRGKVHIMIANGPTHEIYDSATQGPLQDPEMGPAGFGWEFSPTLHMLSSPRLNTAANFDEVIAIMNEPVWHRVKQAEEAPGAVMRLYTERDADRDGEDATIEGVALHEFGHRMEQVLPDNILGRQERAFLARRTGKTELPGNQRYEEMRQIAGMEFGQDAKMVNAYMARDYFNDRNYEVFTTGIEALYGGAYGGLMAYGEGSSKKDREHRGFVLGALAVL